jgi:hypothetical protein
MHGCARSCQGVGRTDAAGAHDAALTFGLVNDSLKLLPLHDLVDLYHCCVRWRH